MGLDPVENEQQQQQQKTQHRRFSDHFDNFLEGKRKVLCNFLELVFFSTHILMLEFCIMKFTWVLGAHKTFNDTSSFLIEIELKDSCLRKLCVW